jgi:hypothetical protein
LDRAQGSIQVIARETEDYRSISYPVFDSYGNTVTQFDAAHQAAVSRQPSQTKRTPFTISSTTSGKSSACAKQWRMQGLTKPFTTIR